MGSSIRRRRIAGDVKPRLGASGNAVAGGVSAVQVPSIFQIAVVEVDETLRKKAAAGTQVRFEFGESEVAVRLHGGRLGRVANQDLQKVRHHNPQTGAVVAAGARGQPMKVAFAPQR